MLDAHPTAKAERSPGPFPGPRRHRAIPLLALLAALGIGGWWVAGARGALGDATEVSVCVLTPRVRLRGSAVPRATVALPAPTIFAAGSFEELRIERQGTLLWRRLAPLGAPIEGPLAWPLPPLRPGETLLLRLRPAGLAGDGHFATVAITGGERRAMERANLLLRELGDDPERWLQAVRTRLNETDVALALALLFHVDGPSSDDLDALRREVYLHSCSESP